MQDNNEIIHTPVAFILPRLLAAYRIILTGNTDSHNFGSLHSSHLTV